jgi:hypothetical protein
MILLDKTNTYNGEKLLNVYGIFEKNYNVAESLNSFPNYYRVFKGCFQNNIDSDNYAFGTRFHFCNVLKAISILNIIILFLSLFLMDKYFLMTSILLTVGLLFQLIIILNFLNITLNHFEIEDNSSADFDLSMFIQTAVFLIQMIILVMMIINSSDSMCNNYNQKKKKIKK